MKKFILATLVAISLNAFAQETSPEYEALILDLTAKEFIPLASPTEETVIEAMKPTFPNVTPQQAELLALAEQIATKDGHKEPKLLQGLLMQESTAGANPAARSALNRCYGVLQIKIAAAIDVLTEFPELAVKYELDVKNRASIKRLLMHDDEFNLSVGSKYLLILQRYGYVTMKQLALAYNQGAGGAKKLNANTFPYVKGVVKHLTKLYPQ